MVLPGSVLVASRVHLRSRHRLLSGSQRLLPRRNPAGPVTRASTGEDSKIDETPLPPPYPRGSSRLALLSQPVAIVDVMAPRAVEHSFDPSVVIINPDEGLGSLDDWMARMAAGEPVDLGVRASELLEEARQQGEV